MKLDLNFSGTTKLKDWWKQVFANFNAIESECTEKFADVDKLMADAEQLSEEIKTERTDRINTDYNNVKYLQTNITNVKAAVEEQIAAERESRLESDTNMQEKIDENTQEIALVKNSVGDSAELKTTAKESAVYAINEVYDKAVSAKDQIDNFMTTTRFTTTGEIGDEFDAMIKKDDDLELMIFNEAQLRNNNIDDLSERINQKADKSCYASETSFGLVKLYTSEAGANISGLVIKDGVIYVNAKNGLQRGNNGTLSVVFATEKDILNKTANVSIPPSLIDIAVENIGGSLSELDTGEKGSYVLAINELNQRLSLLERGEG